MKTFSTLAAALVVGTVGCSSSSVATTPTPGSTDCKAGPAAYPTTGLGIEVGQTIANLTFTGKKGGSASPTQSFSLSDFYDPTGAKGNKVLVVDVSALWCTACKEEMKHLPQSMIDYGPKGVTFLTIVAENGANGPANAADVDTWINSFHLTNIVVNDPSLASEGFFDRASMPLNMIIDLRTMKIVAKIIGYDDTQITAQLDAAVAACPGGPTP